MCQTHQVVVHSDTGELRTINLYNGKMRLQDVTVEQLKIAALKELGRRGLSLDMLRLVVEGKPLDNDSARLSEYGVKAMTHVQMVRKVHGG